MRDLTVPSGNPKTIGDFAVRQAIDVRQNDNLVLIGRQSGKRLLYPHPAFLFCQCLVGICVVTNFLIVARQAVRPMSSLYGACRSSDCERS